MLILQFTIELFICLSCSNYILTNKGFGTRCYSINSSIVCGNMNFTRSLSALRRTQAPIFFVAYLWLRWTLGKVSFILNEFNLCRTKFCSIIHLAKSLTKSQGDVKKYIGVEVPLKVSHDRVK